MTINRENEYRKLAEEYLALLRSLQNVPRLTNHTAEAANWRCSVEWVQQNAKSAHMRVKSELARIEKGERHPPDLLERFLKVNPDVMTVDYGDMSHVMEDIEVRIEYVDGRVVNTWGRTFVAHMAASLKETES